MKLSHSTTLLLQKCVSAAWRLRHYVMVLLISRMTVTAALADESQLAVPVRILSAPQPASDMAPMMPREEAPVATPAARMPQYQLHHKDLGDSGDSDSPYVRFVLAAPEQPLVIEASVFIDGQPFRQAREKRIQEIMRYMTDPVAFKAEADRIAAEAQAAATVKDSPSLLESITNLLTGDRTAETEVELEVKKNELKGDTPAGDEIPEATATEPEASSDEAVTALPEAEQDAAAPSEPPVLKYSSPATIYERIDRYAESTGTTPTAEEVRWLLTTWVDGPQLLFLNDNFQRFRADQQPVFKVLDRDRDGTVSPDEMAKAVVSFQECDLNRDEIVEAVELAESSRDVRDQLATASGGKLVYRLPDDIFATAFLRRLATHYAGPDAKSPILPRFDLDSNGVLSPEELKHLRERPADIRLRIELATSQPETSRLTIDGFSEEYDSLKDSARKNPSSLTLSFPSFNLEFLSVQGSSSDQISIGAVNDGYAMLQEIDPDTDGRFSIRELRQLNERLAAFDRNTDGRITSDETHPTFRVCFGLGPTAHQALLLLRDVNSQAVAASVAGPDWFTEMDKNRDYDLTRQEFPGTDEQFRDLDHDGDELISSVEANQP